MEKKDFDKSPDPLFSRIHNALKMYFESMKELQHLGVLTNKKDFTGQIGEWLVASIYDGERAESGIQKDWDISAEGKYFQVKSHSKAKTTTAKWSKIEYNPTAKIDYLIIVVFTSDYKLEHFFKIPWKNALDNIKKEKNSHVIYWSQVSNFKIPLSQLPKQNIIKLF